MSSSLSRIISSAGLAGSQASSPEDPLNSDASSSLPASHNGGGGPHCSNALALPRISSSLTLNRYLSQSPSSSLSLFQNCKESGKKAAAPLPDFIFSTTANPNPSPKLDLSLLPHSLLDYDEQTRAHCHYSLFKLLVLVMSLVVDRRTHHLCKCRFPHRRLRLDRKSFQIRFLPSILVEAGETVGMLKNSRLSLLPNHCCRLLHSQFR